MHTQNQRNVSLSVIAAMVYCAVVMVSAVPIHAADYNQSFDAVSTGALPPGWIAGSTKSMTPLNTWKVQVSATAPSPTKVLALTNIINNASRMYNICYTPDVTMKDGTIEVKIRADSGSVDQGGGIIWRVRDFNNYYLVRYNPLERDIRCYYVKDSVRHEPPLLIVANQAVPTRQWFTLKISNIGSTIEVFLNGVKKGEYSDNTFTLAGGVGLWSKADAASAFDDFSVKPIATNTLHQQTKQSVRSMNKSPTTSIVKIMKNGQNGVRIKHRTKVLMLDGRVHVEESDR